MLPPSRKPTKRPRHRPVAVTVKSSRTPSRERTYASWVSLPMGCSPHLEHNTDHQTTSTSRAAEKERPDGRPAADGGPRVREPPASPPVSDPDRMATDADPHEAPTPPTDSDQAAKGRPYLRRASAACRSPPRSDGRAVSHPPSGLLGRPAAHVRARASRGAPLTVAKSAPEARRAVRTCLRPKRRCPRRARHR